MLNRHLSYMIYLHTPRSVKFESTASYNYIRTFILNFVKLRIYLMREEMGKKTPKKETDNSSFLLRHMADFKDNLSAT